VHERNIASGAPTRQQARRLAIDAHGRCVLLLGFIDQRVSRRIDDSSHLVMRQISLKNDQQFFRMLQIGNGTRKPNTACSQQRNQSASDLTTGSHDYNLPVTCETFHDLHDLKINEYSEGLKQHYAVYARKYIRH
jgi:hypothetical protein